MSLNYINPKRQINEIKHRFSKILPLFDQANKNKDMLFVILTKLGCLINVFYRKRTFSTTDCCSSSESIWNLFGPKNEKEFTIEKSTDLTNLLNNKSYNIFNFRLIGYLTFHNFTILRNDNHWYILQSYVNVCEMIVAKDDQLPYYLKTLLDTGSISLYNELFKTKFRRKNKGNELYYNISAGYFDPLPVKKLKDLITSFIKK